MARAGVSKIDALASDTVTQPHDYFSYRRSRQNDEEDYGRNASSIMLVA
jgi:copper oxidase (laccase) domain-containing protein